MPRGLTRRGVLIRASTLGTLTAADLALVQSSGVRTVVDLAGWSRVAHVPTRLVGWILAPLAAGQPARYRRYDWERDE